MKKELKGFVCGALTTTVLTCGVTFAAGQWKNIDVLENDITVIVDGEQVTESNFVYNDKTYLPLRAVAEAVGKPVEYDEETNTAYIGTRSNARTFSYVGMDNIHISIYQDEAGAQYASFSSINSMTARTGVYTSINLNSDGSWKFSEWNKSTGNFEEKSTGSCVFISSSDGEKDALIPLAEYEEKIKPILAPYVKF